ncbi:MAG: hypothetical protein ACI835_006025 [Planctomycetota bacterium]|jgi:hypothetical protein
MLALPAIEREAKSESNGRVDRTADCSRLGPLAIGA